MGKVGRKEKIAAQKALGVKEGDWIIFPRSLNVNKPSAIKARKEHLDARLIDFLRWRRATEQEVVTAQQAILEREKRQSQFEAERNRPEYIAASQLSSYDTDFWLRLPLVELREIIATIESRRK